MKEPSTTTTAHVQLIRERFIANGCSGAGPCRTCSSRRVGVTRTRCCTARQSVFMIPKPTLGRLPGLILGPELCARSRDGNLNHRLSWKEKQETAPLSDGFSQIFVRARFTGAEKSGRGPTGESTRSWTRTESESLRTELDRVLDSTGCASPVCTREAKVSEGSLSQ